MNRNELFSILKLNNIFLHEKVEQKLCEFVEAKLNLENMLTFYQLTKHYNSSKAAFSYIQRCFTMLSETEGFLELDFIHVLKILASSQLLTSTELEVYNAANSWLGYKIKERSKFAKDLLLTVRFPLLSNYTVKYLLEKSSNFSKIDECYKILQKISEGNEIFFQSKSTIYYTNRYCNQELFSMLVIGGRDISSHKTVGKIKQFNVSNSKNFKALHPMIEKRKFPEAVCVKGEVYVFGGIDDEYRCINSVEKYSPSTNSWKVITKIYDYLKNFCVCAFMDKIFVIGGGEAGEGIFGALDSCWQFDIKGCIGNNWKPVARMGEARSKAACAAYEGRIVVSGGRRNFTTNINTVESYDVVSDTWSPMPNLLISTIPHSLVVVKNKLFVIGSTALESLCQCFDSISNKFVFLKSADNFNFQKAVSIGTKIFVFKYIEPAVLIYDVDKNEWSKESCEATKDLTVYSCVKLPIY